jgi:glycosyltransferase involved in cell wall biosynthesis
MRVLILYQHIDSGAKVATDAFLECLRQNYPENAYHIYQQDSHRFRGRFSFLGNLLWSIIDYRNQINRTPEVDTIYTTVYFAIIAQFFSKKRKIPSIFHLHGDHRFGKLKKTSHPLFFLQAMYASILGKIVLKLQRIAVSRSSKTLFVSDNAKQEFIERYGLKHALHKFSTIYNGVSLHKYSLTQPKHKKILKKKYNITETFVITYLGRIDEKKGIHHLIAATKYIKDRNCTVLIVYPKTKDLHSHLYLSYLKRKAHRASLHIRFIEQPSHVEEMYHISDCVVLPSEQEMLPLVMLESLASGVPFLSTAVGGVPEVLSPFPEFLLRSTQPQYIAEKVRMFFALPSMEKKELRLRERKLAASYTWERSAAQLHKVFEEVTRYSR